MTISNLFQRLIDWLEKNRTLNVVLAFSYFLFIYHMHDPVVHLSVWVMNTLSLAIYNKVVIVISIFFLVLFAVFLFGQLKEHRDNRFLKISYLLIILALITIHFRIMLEMNIEIIHIFEFPFLALLLFPLTKRFGATVIFTLPFMLLDEWHQYVVLYPAYVDYFEFNDVVMDMNGCALAVVALMICGIKGEAKATPLWKRREFILLGILILGVVIALKTCFFALYLPDKCDNTWLVLNRINEPRNFWRQYPGREVIYHVMQPVEAIISITALSLFYLGLDIFRRTSVD